VVQAVAGSNPVVHLAQPAARNALTDHAEGLPECRGDAHAATLHPSVDLSEIARRSCADGRPTTPKPRRRLWDLSFELSGEDF
jgi:hypothetical protein